MDSTHDEKLSAVLKIYRSFNGKSVRVLVKKKQTNKQTKKKTKKHSHNSLKPKIQAKTHVIVVSKRHLLNIPTFPAFSIHSGIIRTPKYPTWNPQR